MARPLYKTMLEIPELKEAERPALLFSGGKDSLLLLYFARAIRPDITVIHFYDQLHPDVEAIIKGEDLNVLSWAPATRYLIPWNEGMALVSEHSFGEARLPVLRDVIPETGRCELERLRQDRTPHFDYPFDLTLWGYRKTDELHPVMPEVFPKDFQLGPTRMLAPLYDWETIDVIEAAQRLPYMPCSDAITVCVKCREVLKGWDKHSAQKFFAKRFGYSEAA